ncbi:hypothetical protein RXV86_21710 [Alisedimentitalea sp. MJ-SS2]|uniref:hypothetical protein n=1 Tax=Aliisedimentitalea sp. MJ-SS2 TaxID=3049795 RepID=UPI00290DFE0F|nr:hypothetical protein [Alisedimentitalea sp. MJ-SS2]MDU8930011.1 hypothetical protein [Alisedimentitalea sp. MJ-SS2]
MKVILYIGHHKVGSTALQVFLSQNSHRLLQAGILYPAVEMQGFSHLLSKAMGRGDKQEFLPANIREPHSALAYRLIFEKTKRPIPPQFKMLPGAAQMLHAIRCQVAQVKPRTLVLCSEAFANFGEVGPELIDRLRTAFPEAELEIYCAFRRPDQYLVAWHGQRIKVAERVPPLHELACRHYPGTIHFDFRKVIEAWHTQLPEARLILRNYADILAAKGSPQDFMAQTGADWPEGLLPVGKPNRSLPFAAMEIVRRASMELPRPMAQKFSQYLIQSGPDLTAHPDDEIEMLTPRDRKTLSDRFHPIHDYLSKLSGAAAFFPDIDELARSRPIPEAQAAAAYLAQLDPAAMPTPEITAFVSTLQAEYGKRVR